MKIKRLWEIVVTLCFVLLLSLIVAKVEQSATTSIASGLRAIDGDSLVSGAVRMRLLGVDAPELMQTCQRSGKPWACGVEAKRALAGYVATVQTVCSGSRRDRYERLLVTCRQGSLDINREMVVKGLAVSFGDYEAEEDAAKASRRGLWAGDFVLPSEWRDKHQPDAATEKPHFSSFF